MTKEEILDEKTKYSWECDESELVVPYSKALNAMDEYAKQQAIAYHQFTAEKGYLPRQHPERNEWGWKRQENQIIWSDWISNDGLYNTFIEQQINNQ